jgi:hypothetical protein
MNCDTRLAINLRLFELGEHDEFIFAIKNYSYIDSPVVFLFRARKEDADENGEVIFKITPDASKLLKPGAFYNFSLLINAFHPTEQTEYKKLTENGNIKIEYGAHDLAIETDTAQEQVFNEIISMRLELLEPVIGGNNTINGEVVGVRLECIDQE